MILQLLELTQNPRGSRLRIMPKDAAYWREYRARRKGSATTTATVAQPQPARIPKETKVPFSESVSISPARAVTPGRNGNVLPEPRKPGNLRVPLCPPAARDVYALAKVLLVQGDSYGDVEAKTGARYIELSEAADAYGDRETWNVVQAEQKRAMSLRIASAAAEAGIRGIRRKVVEKTGADGKTERTVTEEHGTDAALLRVAGEYTDPERHGKLAGRAAADSVGVQIAVVGTVVVSRPPRLPAAYAEDEPAEFAGWGGAVDVEQVEDVDPAPAVDPDPAPFEFDPAPAPAAPVRAVAPETPRFNPFAPKQPVPGAEIHADAGGRP